MKNKISLIITTYNEAETIQQTLDDVLLQTRKPDEVVICDAYSDDGTREILTKNKKKFFSKKIPLTIVSKVGRMSVGRNAAIEKAKYQLIAITDAGCKINSNWLEELETVYQQTKNPVIAGYYYGCPVNNFEKAVVPYVLVMPDKLNKNNFLPATRSVLLEKKVWEKVGRFDERLPSSEDYIFAKKIQQAKIPIAVAEKALVGWLPRKNLIEFFKMIRIFADCDIRAGVIRPKVLLLFARYLVAITLILFVLLATTMQQTICVVLLLFVLYSLWAINKNIRYAPSAWYWLPILQFTADTAVMIGSLQGVISKSERSK